LFATEDHGEITGDTVSGTYEQARADLDAVEKLGISYDEVVQLLEDEGVEKFEASWNDLLKSTEAELRSEERRVGRERRPWTAQEQRNEPDPQPAEVDSG